MAFNSYPFYFTFRMYWGDKNQQIDPMLEEFYTLFYGPARSQMKAFYDYCEARISRSHPMIRFISSSGAGPSKPYPGTSTSVANASAKTGANFLPSPRRPKRVFWHRTDLGSYINDGGKRLSAHNGSAQPRPPRRGVVTERKWTIQ